MAAAACSTAPSVDGIPLDGTSWVVVNVAGQTPVLGREPNLTFGDGALSVWFGCNGGGAQRVEISGSTIKVRELLSTAMACSGPADVDPLDNPIMRIEDALRQALFGANHIAMREGELVISGSGGDVVFRRLQPGESLGHL